jgi:hypothetical protein
MKHPAYAMGDGEGKNGIVFSENVKTTTGN